MDKWLNLIVPPTEKIIDVLKILDENSKQIALVADQNLELLGTVTDGDVRRGLLNGLSLEEPVERVMNKTPITVQLNDDKSYTLKLMEEKKIHQIPVVDEKYRLVDIKLIEDFLQKPKRENWVVLMAGGLGTRLRPLTNDVPKPLLKVGNKPILETIIENFKEQGFYKFILSVNYKAELIQEYFGDGASFGVQIKYIVEYTRLGTAGALSLLEEKPENPIIVMNGDLLTKVNFNYLLDFHYNNNSTATMGVREYEYQVPYGVVNVKNHKLLSIEEKPIHHFFVSAGIYVLNPETLNYIPSNTFYDMPTLFEKLISKKKNTTAFPIREYWLDIGQLPDFEKANHEYLEVFHD